MINEELIGYLPIIENMFNYGIPIKNGIENYAAGKESIEVTIRSNDGKIDMPATKCSISKADNLILLPPRGKNWMESNFVFSYILVKEKNKLPFKKSDMKKNIKKVEEGEKISVPMEIIKVIWSKDKESLIIEPYLKFTPENITKYVDKETGYDIGFKVWPYLFTNINQLKINTHNDVIDSLKKHISFFNENGSSAWISAEAYGKLDITGPGIYNLRRKNLNGIYSYYTGKAINIGERVVAKQNSKTKKWTVGHNKDIQFDEIRYDILSFDQLIDLCKIYFTQNGLEDEEKTEAFKNCIIYGIEGVMNHIVRMILQDHEAEFCNSQFDKESNKAQLYSSGDK